MNPSLWRSYNDSNLKIQCPFPGYGKTKQNYPFNLHSNLSLSLTTIGQPYPSLLMAMEQVALSLINNILDATEIEFINNIYNAINIEIKNNILSSSEEKLLMINNLLDSVVGSSLYLLNNLIETEIKKAEISLINSLLQDASIIPISHTIKIFLDNQDVSNKVESISIKLPESGHREYKITFKDISLYPLCNPFYSFGEERVEVQLDSESFSFFLEERSGDIDSSSSEFEIWGRDKTAILDLPFALPYKTDIEKRNHTALEIINMVRGAIIVNWELPDFVIYSETYSIIDKTPIKIIEDLADVCGAIVMSDENGAITVYSRNYDLSGNPDYSYDDMDVIIIRDEEEEYPEGYNSVTVTGYEDTSWAHSLEIDIISDQDCIGLGQEVQVKIYGWPRMEISISLKNEQGGSGGSAVFLHDGYEDILTVGDICWPEGESQKYYHMYKVFPSATGSVSICVEEV